MVGRLGKGEFREERGLETHLLPYLVSLCVLHCQVVKSCMSMAVEIIQEWEVFCLWYWLVL